MVLITRLRDINQCSELFKRPSYCVSLNRQRSFFFQNLNAIVSSFLLMNDTCKFEFILSSKDYDLNDLCINFINDLFELFETICFFIRHN